LILFAFGDILFVNSNKKYAKNAAPQVPGRLIFRKLPYGMHGMGWPAWDVVFSLRRCSWKYAENRRLFGVMGLE
jgi:hypothetical protein